MNFISSSFFCVSFLKLFREELLVFSMLGQICPLFVISSYPVFAWTHIDTQMLLKAIPASQSMAGVQVMNIKLLTSLACNVSKNLCLQDPAISPWRQKFTCTSSSSLTLLRCDIIARHFWQLTGSPVCMLLGFFNWSNLIATTFVSARRHFLPICGEERPSSACIMSHTALRTGNSDAKAATNNFVPIKSETLYTADINLLTLQQHTNGLFLNNAQTPLICRKYASKLDGLRWWTVDRGLRWKSALSENVFCDLNLWFMNLKMSSLSHGPGNE